MINYLKKSLALALVCLALASCDPGCVEAYQFDSESVTINANPTADGVSGIYDSVNGGQVASWHNTGLRANGDQITVAVSGGWTAWQLPNSGVASNVGLQELSLCTMCAKKPGVNNCICQPSQTPASEPSANGLIVNNDCINNISNQENPALCTCTLQHGNAFDNDAYYIATDYQDKSENIKLPDAQNECRFERGYGLYIGLFGSDGNTVPIRIYQLHSDNQVCDIPTNSAGQCIDDSGNNLASYIYQSPNQKIFVKDDNNGNTGIDPNPADDTYHSPGELIKVIIDDRYYSDNYGYYNLTFLGGVMADQDPGLLEYIVGNFEDFIIGKVGADGTRSDGMAEFFYKSLVQDSNFIFILQILLILYVTLFGFGFLAGVVEISQKDLSKRVMKIALVIFFTSPTSWHFYNQFFIGFFKDGMDSIISMFMNFADSTVDASSMIKISQMDRATDASNATRFAYVDLVIKKLFSVAVTKKIWSLFFGVWFGVLYIPLIYFLIGFFTFTVLTVALIYITAMLKLIFVISLGPIFIISSLFVQTEGMFKKWISFMAGTSMEVITLFIIFYLFLSMIDKSFTDLLSFRACVEPVNIGLISLNIMQVDTNRDLLGWMSRIINIGALIFMLRIIIEQIPVFASSLVKIAGTDADGAGGTALMRKAYNEDAMGIAKDITGKLFNAGKAAVNQGLPYALRKAHNASGAVSDATGLTEKWDQLKEKIPFRNPVSIMRDVAIDDAIKNSAEMAKKKGLTGKALDAATRKGAFEYIYKASTDKNNKFNFSEQKKLKLSLLGLNAESIGNRLDEKLVKEPLKKFIKEEAERLKNVDAKDILLGEEMREKIKENARVWANNNLSTSDGVLEKYLSNLKGLMKEEGELSGEKAARKFLDNPEMQSKYLEHLKSEQFKKQLQSKSDEQTKLFGGTRNSLENFAKSVQGTAAYNPNSVEKDFIRESKYHKQRIDEDKDRKGIFKRGGNWILEKAGINTSKGLNPIKRVGFLDWQMDKLRRDAKDKIESEVSPPQGLGKATSVLRQAAASGTMDFKREAKEKEISSYQDYLNFGWKKELAQIKSIYDSEISRFNAGSSTYSKVEIERNRKEAEELLVKKAKEYSKNLREHLGDIRSVPPDLADPAIRSDGAAYKPAAVPDDPQQKIITQLTAIENADIDLSKAKNDNEKDNMLAILKPVPQDLKDFHQASKSQLKSDMDNLRMEMRNKEKKIAKLKKDNLPEEKGELAQLEFELAKDDRSLSMKKMQEQKIDDELSKL